MDEEERNELIPKRNEAKPYNMFTLRYTTYRPANVMVTENGSEKLQMNCSDVCACCDCETQLCHVIEELWMQ